MKGGGARFTRLGFQFDDRVGAGLCAPSFAVMVGMSVLLLLAVCASVDKVVPSGRATLGRSEDGPHDLLWTGNQIDGKSAETPNCS